MAGKKGRTTKSADKLWSDAVRRAVNRYHVDSDGTKLKKLNAIANKVVDMAIDGDIAAIREVGNRIEGRAPLKITAPEGESGSMTIKWKGAK